MTRNFGWRFQDMGRRIERAFNLAELLLALFSEAPSAEEETARLFFVLNVADSTITFRQRYLFAPVLQLILDLLVVDEFQPAWHRLPVRHHLGSPVGAAPGDTALAAHR